MSQSNIVEVGENLCVDTWDAVNGEWSATPKTYTTDSVGKITIKVTDMYDNETRVYQTDTAYCIMETTAPPGYLLPENPRPFYFWFSKYESAPHAGPDDFMLTAADISTSSYRIEAENRPIPYHIPNTGIFDTRLLSSFIAMLAAGFVVVLVIFWIVKKKKNYDMD